MSDKPAKKKPTKKKAAKPRLPAGFHEAWFPKASCDVLARLVGEVADVPGLIIEIGSWEGMSTMALANAAHPRMVNAVDTWRGSPGEESADLAAQRDVYAQWSANMLQHTRGNVTAHRMGWRDYVKTVNEPVALLFIDAEHTYVEVRDTIAAFRPLMSPGGIMVGDDVHHGPVHEAALEAFPDGDQDATLWIGRC